MWRQFLGAHWKIIKFGLTALFAATLAALLNIAPVFSQVPLPQNDNQTSRNVDPLTRAVEGNPLTLIRIAALSLKEPSHQGEALSGLVSALLARNKPDDAAIEMKAITDPLWRARALIHVADDQKRRGRIQTAKNTLNKSLELAQGKQMERDAGATAIRIAERYIALEAFQDATNTTLLIPDKFEQIRLLLKIATQLQQSKLPVLKTDSKKVLAAAFKIATSIRPTTKESITTIIRIAEFQIGADDQEGARQSLAHTENVLEKRRFMGRDQLRADLAAALVLIDDPVAAQAIVRSTIDIGRRARAIASIARASAQKGNMEAAVSLFTLAFEQTEKIKDKTSKYMALTHIIVEQAKVGLLADAFRYAGVIRDRKPQALALLKMGRVLLKQKKYNEAVKLVDFIPYVSMRSQIFVPVALDTGLRGDREKASNYLTMALKETRFKATPLELKKALPLVIDAQSKAGSVAMNDALFKRVLERFDKLPDDSTKIHVLTRIAIAEARSRRQTAALRALAGAWRISWLNRKNPKYPSILTDLMKAQIEVGELLQAFDIAARVPDSATPPQQSGQLEASLNARNAALRRVAVAAAAKGKQRLALRAAGRIRDIASRARVYGEIAKAFPSGEKQDDRIEQNQSSMNNVSQLPAKGKLDNAKRGEDMFGSSQDTPSGKVSSEPTGKGNPRKLTP